MAAGEFRRLAHRAVDIVADDLVGTQGDPSETARRPATREYRERAMVAPLPVDAREGDPSLDAFVADVLPYPMGNDSPRFFA
ncbi:MAG: hypothetical protein OEY20_17470 [Gemmatimonadota bacterium]|jgi:hypothetical protein|nr:hypothetical protein [Chloroflexota bacterium]MDH5199036.1 hypothetical protein [Gemmatimonadota bacterium]